MRCTGEIIENPKTGDRMIFRRRAKDTRGKAIEIEWYLQPGNPAPAHYHTIISEEFEILAGIAAYKLAGSQYTAVAGTVVQFPSNVAQVHPWNVGTDTLHMVQRVNCPIEAIAEMSTAEDFAETMYALAQMDKVASNGLPRNPLQIATLLAMMMPYTYLDGIPVGVQHLLFGSLAKLGQVVGCKKYIPASTIPVAVVQS